MKKIVITGGAGFIGSHIVERFVALYPAAEIVVLDKMTYAADVRNILPLMTEGRIQLIVGDIVDPGTCERAVKGADLVIHAAAESHVDNSFGNSYEFTKTNVAGTHCLIEAARRAKVERFIHVSTDEVYGEVLKGKADEDTVLRPTNPYSASKAAAEMIINGYRQSFKFPVIVVRANNIFGIRQYPEKIIPKFLLTLMMGRQLTIHGSGKNIRHYLSAWDLADALDLLIKKGEVGGCYNIGTAEEYTNLEMARMICDVFGLNSDEHITYVQDRPFNDARYALDWGRIEALGWKAQRKLKTELPAIANWYAANLDRYEDPNKVVRKPLRA
ncbi:MAG TPA: dTDP-glucose 4,6-dehydratase [Patescibacteria group bacterium]|nr:dTDP-glucose 4,6-dehydratase [Patescibacteria group bacterium]